MRLRREAEEVTEDGDSERGAVILLIAVFLAIFMVVAAFAVDLSALERRGQTLQSTADAAALAGVVTWQATGDEGLTQAKIDDIVRQNGVDSGVRVVMTPRSLTEITVVVTDDDPDVFLGNWVPGYNPTLERAASARLEDCSTDCGKQVVIPRPFNALEALGSGDGYVPLKIGDRFYGINHGSDEIACVDRFDEQACWTGRSAYASSSAVAGPVAHAEAVGTKIWWAAQEETQLSLFCWETLDEMPCDDVADIASLAKSPESLGNNFALRGGGVVATDDDRIFVFSDDHRAHCFRAATGSRCTGYLGGIATTLGEESFPALDPALGTSGSNIDRILHPDGRIFHTLHVRKNALSEPVYNTGVFLQCFDTTNNRACTNFTSYELHAQGRRQEGRLYFARTSTGSPDGVCSTGISTIVCTDLAGNPSPSITARFLNLEAALPPADQYGAGMGVHYYHQPSNRLIMVAPRKFSTNHCWDFTTSSYCNSIFGMANGFETQDYGFISEGDCIFALGHNSIFWSFTANDFTAGCPGTTKVTEVNKCPCRDTEEWGEVRFQFDVGIGSPFTVLNVKVVDADPRDPNASPNTLLPNNGDEWASFVQHPTGIIDLSDIDLSLSAVWVVVYAEANPLVPYDDADPPTFIHGITELPHLTE